jgi:hypothetical protein
MMFCPTVHLMQTILINFGFSPEDNRRSPGDQLFELAGGFHLLVASLKRM